MPFQISETVLDYVAENPSFLGSSNASFGEIVQGRLSTHTDFLVTLPIDLWSHCKLTLRDHSGSSIIDCDLPKSKQLAEAMLKYLNKTSGLSISLAFERNIPIGKGLSSSTADLLALIRAFESAFKTRFTQDFTSTLLAQIEPHDPLHYASCVAYNHRRGELLEDFAYTPNYQIIGVDTGGTVSTQDYNRQLYFNHHLLQQYDQLYRALLIAFEKKDDLAIAQCATQSTELHILRTEKSLFAPLLDYPKSLGIMGIIATHSGTCAGLLLPGNCSSQTLHQAKMWAVNFGHVFQTRTLCTALRC